MGSRDHSMACATCGVQRGGLNDLKCRCDEPTSRNMGHFTKKRERICAVAQISAAPGDLSLTTVRSLCTEVPIRDLHVALKVHRANCQQPDCPVLAVMVAIAKARELS